MNENDDDPCTAAEYAAMAEIFNRYNLSVDTDIEAFMGLVSSLITLGYPPSEKTAKLLRACADAVTSPVFGKVFKDN